MYTTFRDWCGQSDKGYFLDLWDYELNKCNPQDILYKSNKRFYFKCSKGVHESFSRRIADITTKGSASKIVCPKCNSFEQWCLDNDHEDYLDLWDYNLNDVNPSEIGFGSNKKYWFKCSRGLHKSDVIKISNSTSTQNTPIKCKKCNSFGQYLLDTYGENALDLYWDKSNIINPFDIDKCSLKKVKIKCLDLNHGSYEITCANFYNGNRCSVCAGKRVVLGVNAIINTHPQVVKYLADINDATRYTSGSDKKVNMICPFCKTKAKIILSNLCLRGFTCKKCDDGISFPNKVMFNILLSQDIVNLTPEYQPLWAEGKRYDFYFEKNNKAYIIEMDGGFHYGDNGKSGKSLDKSIEIDKWKDNQALLNGIYLVRIDCNYKSERLSYIKSNIISGLDWLLDFSMVDWDIVFMESSCSLLQKAIELWNQNPYKVSTDAIAKELNVCRATIQKYLKIGYKLGLCDYDTDKITKATLSNGYKYRMKRIFVYDLNCNKIHEFESREKLIQEFSKMYGIKLIPASITNCCQGKTKSYKGYVFRYAE